MRIHELKCRKKYFNDIISGAKPFEVRRKDRDFRVGDILALNEISDDDHPSVGAAYTERAVLALVTYILDEPSYCKDGFVVLGIRLLEVAHLLE